MERDERRNGENAIGLSEAPTMKNRTNGARDRVVTEQPDERQGWLPRAIGQTRNPSSIFAAHQALGRCVSRRTMRHTG